MIHRYIYPRTDEKEHGKMPSENNPNNNTHVWKKTNLLATSQLLKELADRAVVKIKQEQEDHEEDTIFMSVKNAEKDLPVESTYVLDLCNYYFMFFFICPPSSTQYSDR